MADTFQNLVNGEWTNSNTGETFESTDPANGELLGAFPASNAEDVEKAVEAANNAFEEWSSTPTPKRGEILLNIAHRLRENKQELGELVTREMGKVLPEGLGDVQEAIDIFEYMAGEGRRLFGHTTPSELPNKAAYTLRQPLGPVGLITPWNFPIAIPAWKLAPALVCGCTVVFKPAEDTPLCAQKLVEIIQDELEKAGAPNGVVNMVHGFGEDVGQPIVEHEDLRGVSFTGSREVGSMVAEKAGKQLKHVGLELGGKNPIIVMEDADLDLAVDGAVWGGFGTTGQRCTAASRLIVHEDVYNDFLEKFKAAAENLKLGHGLEKDTDVGPIVNEKQLDRVHSYTEIAENEDKAKILLGGKKHEGDGNFYVPTIFEATPDMRIAQEEIFGPCVSLLKVSSLQEAINVANNVGYGLSSAIYTNNIMYAMKAVEKLDAGLTYVNASTIGSEVHLPFGGVKDTGNGTREAGIHGIDEFTEIKTVYIDYSGAVQKAQGIEWGSE